MSVNVAPATEASTALHEALSRLVPQLSSSSPPPTPAELAAIINCESTSLLVALDGEGVIVGCLTLVTFRIPTGVRAFIEDVVVDQAARGQGVGEALTRSALEEARSRGARNVDLTSRPSRQDANRLYRRLGFEERETNVYRFTL